MLQVPEGDIHQWLERQGIDSASLSFWGGETLMQMTEDDLNNIRDDGSLIYGALHHMRPCIPAGGVVVGL